jgi:hypothetical protein
MVTMLKSSFFWQVASGFALGVVGMVALQPAEATQTMVSHFAPVAVPR